MKDLPQLDDWAKQIREKLAAGNKRRIGDIFNSDSILGAASKTTTTAAPTTTTTVRYDSGKNLVENGDSVMIGFNDKQPHSTYYPAHPQNSDQQKYLPLHDGESYPEVHIDYPSDSKQILPYVGPSSFKTTHYDAVDGIVGEIHSVESQNRSPNCECDSAQLENLLRQMDLEFHQYRENVAQHFNAYKAQINVGQAQNAASSNFCDDEEYVRANPEVSNLCDDVDDVKTTTVDYPTTFHEQSVPKGFEGQFMSYADYAKMVQSPNGNQNTVNNLYDGDDYDYLQHVHNDRNSRVKLITNLKDLAQSQSDDIGARSKNVDDEKNLQAVNPPKILNFVTNGLLAQKAGAFKNILKKLKGSGLMRKNNLIFRIKK